MGLLVYTVVGQDRLRIPWAVAGPALGSERATLERVAVMGGRGGVAIHTQAEIDEALALVDLDSLAAGEAATPLADAARFLTVRWPMSFRYEKNGDHYSVNMPAGARKMGLLPDAGGAVVVFVAGGLFELWEAGQWRERQRSLGTTLAGIVADLRPEGA